MQYTYISRSARYNMNDDGAPFIPTNGRGSKKKTIYRNVDTAIVYFIGILSSRFFDLFYVIGSIERKSTTTTRYVPVRSGFKQIFVHLFRRLHCATSIARNVINHNSPLSPSPLSIRKLGRAA